MFCMKLNDLMKYAGMVGSGIVIGAVFTGVAIQLPMLIEAKWGRETKQIIFDSRICKIEEIAIQDIGEEDIFNQ